MGPIRLMTVKSKQLSLIDKAPGRPKVAKRAVTLNQLISFDEELKHAYGSDTIIGVDEVGRGCLAGPVYAAAVVVPAPGFSQAVSKKLQNLNDSKQLTAQAREQIAPVLEEHVLWSVASASPAEIDQLNIFHASLLAMRRAIEAMIVKYQWNSVLPLVVVDGKAKIPLVSFRQVCVIKGDEQSASVAAASILAKVHRDSFMRKLSEQLPHYDWQNNKGYACRAHVGAIVKHGPTVWHRRSFLKKI